MKYKLISANKQEININPVLFYLIGSIFVVFSICFYIKMTFLFPAIQGILLLLGPMIYIILIFIVSLLVLFPIIKIQTIIQNKKEIKNSNGYENNIDYINALKELNVTFDNMEAMK